ncbi:SDR family oxidoreductase [Bradyrhizobium sp. STM 3809]|uniref:SDR family oxidoreductase n=1 Tax=Bradyrhizobium sp. STM 3809 TaxID=551936 RepID=UPI0002408308|nr:SDR family oxidoreductase [Bradyrhizobium sp. STM 3809]CCE03892.1 putative 3-oxacyl-ACP reductase [Bradyrhizobium sp. STM 3809]
MAQVVVISGGGTGIGLATARTFAGRGAQVVIVGRRKSVIEAAAASIAAEQPHAPAPLAITADLAEVEQVEATRTTLEQRFAAVDVLVNAAGGHVARRAPTNTYDDSLAGVARRWTDNFRLNTLTAVLLTEALMPRLRAPGGRIIFVSSIAAYRGSGEGSYGAAKAALHPYSADLARRLGPRGITVNVVAPGYVADTEFFGAAMSEAQLKSRIDETMNGRAGTPDDIAATISWLASAEAAHVTAQIVQVNGGAERGR